MVATPTVSKFGNPPAWSFRIILALVLDLAVVSWSHQIPTHNTTSSGQGPPPIRVAVIGAGPGGLFLAHSVRRRLQSKQKNAPDIQVTLFEQSSSPGGVWKATDDDSTITDESPHMYAALWTNGPSHGIEFSDYTFDDHFKSPVSVYLPRQNYLEYMLARVQRVLTAIETNTRVDYVSYIKERRIFFVTTTDTRTSKSSIRTFDKVVWAGGGNGKLHIPQEYNRALKKFTGTVIHSSESLGNLRNKRVLLIGGSSSAEDLALRAIQLGADHVVVVQRGWNGMVSRHSAWPYDKVTVVDHHVVVGAEGSTVFLAEFTEPEDYKDAALAADDIDVIVFCTGYAPNFSMLEPALRPRGYLSPSHDYGQTLSVPEDWKMCQPAWLQDSLGDVPLGADFEMYSLHAHPDLYRGVMIENTNMMFLPAFQVELPILEIDVSAWLLSGFLTGEVTLPTASEMRRINDEQALAELSIPYERYLVDSAYREAVGENWDPNWDNWTDGYDVKTYESAAAYDLRLLARSMQEGGYELDIGTFKELNSNGTALLRFLVLSYLHGQIPDHQENPWRTYRDCEDSDSFYSLQTGTKAIALTERWLDLDAPPGVSTRLYDTAETELDDEATTGISAHSSTMIEFEETEVILTEESLIFRPVHSERSCTAL